MERLLKSFVRRGLPLCLALVFAAGLTLPAFAEGAQIPASHDETFYATLDYYGGVLDSSVVKSYKTYGSDTITDYGVYDQVTNLTDGREPTLGEGTVTFQLGEDAPSRFYFEGKTTQPLEEFPWKLSLSYTLNGVPTRAEELAGRTGLVEITLDALPNPAASEYSRNNLVLTAMSLFNGDDILSLEAEGAQVQLIGNLYCVLYMVMPGEEQHFTIRVGAEDFSYDGMIFLAVPATLQQLDQIADLREAKEDVEDSYEAIQDSLDVILDSLDGMSGSLNATANGLDRLNQARDTISGGKDKVYDSLDTALDAAGPLADSLRPMAEHLTAAQQALADTTALLNQMNDNLQGLKPEVENTRKILKNLQSDLDELQELLDDLEDDDVLWRGEQIAKDLSADFSRLGNSMNNLRDSLEDLQSGLSSLEKQVSQLEASDNTYITINGKTVKEIRGALAQANQLRAAYEASEYNGVIPFQQFIAVYLQSQGMDEATASASAASLAGLWEQAQEDGFQEQLAQAEQINELLSTYGVTVRQLKTAVEALAPGGADLADQLSGLCSALDSRHLSGDLKDLSDLLEDTFDTLDDHSGTLSSTAGTLKSACELAQRVSANLDTALDQTQSLTDIMNTYEPTAQQALEDAKTFSDSAAVSISALVDAAKTAEALVKESGRDLDAGTQQALAGLSAALRQSTKGLSQTGTIRGAKDTIDALIHDQWDSHAGGDNNLLLMDAGAQPVSLTDSRNGGTSSIQYIMRSQEIKAEEPGEEELAAVQKDNGTIWTRIADMFRDIWNTITGWFRH